MKLDSGGAYMSRSLRNIMCCVRKGLLAPTLVPIITLLPTARKLAFVGFLARVEDLARGLEEGGDGLGGDAEVTGGLGERAKIGGVVAAKADSATEIARKDAAFSVEGGRDDKSGKERPEGSGGRLILSG